jgi:acyl carrier protein
MAKRGRAFARRTGLGLIIFITKQHMQHVPQKLIDYINENRAPLPPVSDPTEPLQIDSLGLIRLVSFMENDCGIRVEDEELVAENFATLESLDALIARKSQSADAASS